MNRKTNLFYTSGPDSKFLTFSNYAESMTGNFLSVDTKIFPSRFLCLKINDLNSKSKPAFIRFLVSYYENKLAYLRDNVVKPENSMCPFAYFIEGLSKILFTDDNGENKIIYDSLTDKVVLNDTPDINSINIYSAEITEQDYNGIYTDIICSIDLNEVKKCSIGINEDINEIESLNDISENIYGWDNIDIIPGYEGVKAIFDDIGNDEVNSYKINTNIEKLIFQSNDQSLDSLSFNVIIPLYEITDINYNTNDTILGYDERDEENDLYIVYVNSYNRYRHNVPLGIWLYADSENDDFIEIKRDNITKTSPVWSLLISTQFKPFPYSTKYEIDATNTDKGAAFATFSQVLLRLNNVMNKFEETNNRISDLETRLHTIQTLLNNVSSVQSLDNLNKKINLLSNDIHNEVNEFKEEVKTAIENIKWKYQ